MSRLGRIWEPSWRAWAVTNRRSPNTRSLCARLRRIPASDSISVSALYKADRFVEATQEFAAAHALAPDNKQIMLLLGDCYLRQGENRRVIDLLERRIQVGH